MRLEIRSFGKEPLQPLLVEGMAGLLQVCSSNDIELLPEGDEAGQFLDGRLSVLDGRFLIQWL